MLAFTLQDLGQDESRGSRGRRTRRGGRRKAGNRRHSSRNRRDRRDPHIPLFAAIFAKKASLTFLNKVNELFQYIIIVAGQEDDPFSRQLGPIHLIKYLYLADLSYAKSHEGQTYTGLQWKLHNYGPWAIDAFNQIEPALSIIYAEKQTISNLS